MKENDELNNTIGKMRDVHENRNSAPDKSQMEQSVIRRLVSGIRLGRIIIALLVLFIAAALVAGAYWKFFRPADIRDGKVTWNVGSVEVTRYIPDDKIENPPVYYLVSYHDPLLHEGSYFHIIECDEPLEGCRYVARAIEDDGCYFFFPADENVPNDHFNIQGTRTKLMYKISGVTEKMLSFKLWPAPLWKLRPAIEKLNACKYRRISPGPYSGHITAAKQYFGKEYVYTLLGLDWGMPYKVNLTIWPDHFALQPSIDSRFTLLGDESGYTAYQQDKCWGSNVKETIILSKKTLWMHSRFLALSPRSVSPEFSRSLSEVVGVLWEHGPDSLQSASLNEQRMMLKPWFWEGYDPEMEVRRNEYRNTRPDLIPCTIGGVEISKPKGRSMKLARGDTSLNIKSNYTSVGTYVDVQVNDEDKLKFYIRHEKSYPLLETTFDDDTEALLAEAANIASAVLAEPESAWPEGRVPEPYLESWLGAIASRGIVLQTESHLVFVHTEIHWEGSEPAMALSFGEYKYPDIDLLLEPRGFQLHLKASGSLLACDSGKAKLLRVPGGREDALTTREIERLEACVAALDALMDYKPASVSPRAEFSNEGMLVHKLPSQVLPGIEELRLFLADPKLPSAETVTELPELNWDYDAVLARNELLGN